MVTERIDDHAIAISPKHIPERHDYLRTGTRRPLKGRIGIRNL